MGVALKKAKKKKKKKKKGVGKNIRAEKKKKKKGGGGGTKKAKKKKKKIRGVCQWSQEDSPILPLPISCSSCRASAYIYEAKLPLTKKSPKEDLVSINIQRGHMPKFPSRNVETPYYNILMKEKHLNIYKSRIIKCLQERLTHVKSLPFY